MGIQFLERPLEGTGRRRDLMFEAEELSRQTQTEGFFQRKKRAAFAAGRTILNTLDHINKPFYAMSGILAGVGAREGIRQRMTVSRVLLGDTYFADRMKLEGLPRVVARVGEFALRLGVDLFTDPVNWVSFGLGSAYRLVSKGGKLIRTNKTGIEMMREITDSKIAQAVRNYKKVDPKTGKIDEAATGVINRWAKREGEKTLSRMITGVRKKEHIDGIKPYMPDVLKKLDIDPTDANINKAIKEGLPQLRAKHAFRMRNPFMSKQEFEIYRFDRMAPVITKISQQVRAGLEKTKFGKRILETERNFNRGIKEVMKRFGAGRGKDPLLDHKIDETRWSIFRGMDEVSKRINVLRAGLAQDSGEKIGQAYFKYKHFLDKGDRKMADESLAVLTENEKTTLREFQKVMREIAKIEERRGLLEHTLPLYVPGLYRNKEAAGKYLNEMLDTKLSAIHKHGKHKVIRNPMDLPDDVRQALDPVYDIFEIWRTRTLAHLKAVNQQDLLLEVGKKWGKVARADSPAFASRLVSMGDNAWIPFKDYVVGLKHKAGAALDPEIAKELKKLPNTWIPKWVGDELLMTANKGVFREQWLNEGMTALGRWQMAFKYGVTVPFIAFHFRNFYTNILQSFIDIGFGSFIPRFRTDFMDLVQGKTKQFTDDFGEVITRDELMKEMMENNIKTRHITMVEGPENRFIDKIRELPYFKHMDRLGMTIENDARMLHYYVLRKRGLDKISASQRVNQTLVDYTAGSDFERRWMMTIFPFYRWYKNNIVFSYHRLMTEPGRYSQLSDMWHAVNEFYGTKRVSPEEERFLPLWIKNQPKFWKETGKDKTYWLHNFDLPLEHAVDMTFREPIRGALNMLSPFIKAGLELGTGINTFRRMPIEQDVSGEFARLFPNVAKDWLNYKKVQKIDPVGRKYEIETVDSDKKWLFNTFATIMGAGRLFSTASIDALESSYRLLSGQTMTQDDWDRFYRILTGIMIYRQDPEADRARVERELYREYGDYLRRRGLIKEFRRYYQDDEARIIQDFTE